MKSEYNDYLDDTMDELKDIQSWINHDRNKFDSKTRYLVSYGVILASGTVEVVFKRILYDYLSTDAKEKTALYLEKMILDSSCNPNTGNICNLLQNISGDWKELFDERVKKSGKKDKINSLVQLRNDFAHGDRITVSIDTVITYYNASIDILHILDDVVK